MSFEVDRYPSAWAHIAQCADLTWSREPPDEFNLANQRLWAQHCRVSQILQDASADSQTSQTNQCEISENRSCSSRNQENGSSSGSKSVKDVIPESRLAQFYGNFYYDEGKMLHKCQRQIQQPRLQWARLRKQRSYRVLDAPRASERWSLAGTRGAGEEALAARVRSVRPLWAPRAASPPRAPSPPPAPRKMRARRRQPRRLATLAPPPPAYCLEAPAQLFCDPTCKFQFDTPRPPQASDRRGMGRLSASVQAVMRAAAARCPPYRGTTVTRYAPTRAIWWPRDPDRRVRVTQPPGPPPTAPDSPKTAAKVNPAETLQEESKTSNSDPKGASEAKETPESPRKETVVVDSQMPPSAAAIETGLLQKRLYSTVLSMSAPSPINLAQVGCVRLSQKLVPSGLLKLNPKIVLPGRRPNVDNKFEELEKEALEQYKASDESIDTKFSELEKQAVDEYSTSNSNTSCSSGNSAEKKPSTREVAPENDPKTKKQPGKFHKEKAVDSVVIYSQNFPDLNAKSKTTSVTNLKNFHTPPRGEKKEQTHRSNKTSRSLRSESKRAASDTDYDSRENRGTRKGPMRWTLHVVPPKKRHLTLCVSDLSSDEEMEAAGPRTKHRAGGKVKMSAHGGGDLRPIMRKT